MAGIEGALWGLKADLGKGSGKLFREDVDRNRDFQPGPQLAALPQGGFFQSDSEGGRGASFEGALELELDGDLHDAGAAAAAVDNVGNDASAEEVELAFGELEVGVVEDVEKLVAELEIAAFAEAKIL